MDSLPVLLISVTNALISMADEFITQWDKYHPSDPIQLLDRAWFNHRGGEIYEHILGTNVIIPEGGQFTENITIYLDGIGDDSLCVFSSGQSFLSLAGQPKRKTDTTATAKAVQDICTTARESVEQLVNQLLGQHLNSYRQFFGYLSINGGDLHNVEDLVYDDILADLASNYLLSDDEDGLFIPIKKHHGLDINLYRDLGFVIDQINNRVTQILTSEERRTQRNAMPKFPPGVPEGQLILEGIS